MAHITTRTLRRTWRGQDLWISDGGPRGAGRLVARITRDGVALYFQYFNPPGKRKWLPLGSYDETGARGLSLPKARDRAAELSALYRSGVVDLHEHFRREREAEERQRAAEEEAMRRAEEDKQRGTLRQLLDAYVAHLRRLGKGAADAAEGIFRLHVLEASPDLAARKAADIGADQYTDLIRKLVEAGKGRTAGKLRSYLRAAYQLAVDAPNSPAVPLVFKSFGIRANPIASIRAKTLREFNRARERWLTAPELGTYLRHVDKLRAGAQRDALQLLLLLGGQRPQQLLRVRSGDVDLSAETVTLYDPKGARSQPRRHVLPLVGEAAVILKRRLDATEGDAPLFSSDGKTAMRIDTLSTLVTALSSDMKGAGDSREPFQLRDLRRTAETMLASLGVSSDVRAQLQSHGLGGIQQIHYDKHDYAREKREALEMWARHLDQLKTGKNATVTPIRRKRQQQREARA